MPLLLLLFVSFSEFTSLFFVYFDHSKEFDWKAVRAVPDESKFRLYPLFDFCKYNQMARDSAWSTADTEDVVIKMEHHLR